MKDRISCLNFFAMLSSEKSLAYWEPLRLPVTRKQYQKTLDFAQGGMELILYPYVKKEIQIYNFRESWKEYRIIGGILNDSFLERNALDVNERTDEETLAVITQVLKKEMDFTEIDAILKWALAFFQTSEDPIVRLGEEMDLLLNKLKENSNSSTNKDFITNHIERIMKFRNHIKFRNRSLERHFEIADNVYSMTLPDEWELVLQSYLNEGYTGSYPWMSSIKYTLEYINLFERWSELKHDMGETITNVLIDLLEDAINVLPHTSYYGCEDIKRLREL